MRDAMTYVIHHHTYITSPEYMNARLKCAVICERRYHHHELNIIHFITQRIPTALLLCALYAIVCFPIIITACAYARARRKRAQRARINIISDNIAALLRHRDIARAAAARAAFTRAQKVRAIYNTNIANTRQRARLTRRAHSRSAITYSSCEYEHTTIRENRSSMLVEYQ